VRSRTPWVVASLLLLASGLFLVYLSFVFRWVDCNAEADSRCSAAGGYAIYASVAGEALLSVMLIESLRPGGRPKVWLALALAAYLLWFALLPT
jgi:hypothetical protein